MRIDLQVHTILGSPDSHISPGDIPEACRSVGLDGVGVTEHSPASFGELERSLSEASLILLPGREVSCGIAHLLVFSADLDLLFGLSRLVAPNDPVFDRNDVACVWAHPAAAAGSGAYPPMVPPGETAGRLVHGVEVLNGKHLAFGASVEAATGLAASLGVASTGGSDAHEIADLGRCFTEIQAGSGSGVSEVIAAMRRGAMRPVLSKAWAHAHGYDYREDLRGYLG